MFSIKNSEIRYYYYIIRVWMKEGWRLPPPPPTSSKSSAVENPEYFCIVICICGCESWIFCFLVIKKWIYLFYFWNSEKSVIHAIMSALFMHLCIHASVQLLFLSSFQALPNPQLDRTDRRLKIYPSNDKGNSKL